MPLNPTLFLIFTYSLLPNSLARQSPTTHIHWEIVIFMPPPPPPKKQKKPKIAIGGKVTFPYPPVTNASPAAPNDASAWYPASTVSNFPYSLINCN